MFLIDYFIKWFAHFTLKKEYYYHQKASEIQLKILTKLLKKAKSTQFGLEHKFLDINNYDKYKKNVSIKSYVYFEKYINCIKKGEANVLWKGRPIYFAKTSGTTSGSKFIPITKESIKEHIRAARNVLLAYIRFRKNASIFSRKMIFLQGSPKLKYIKNIGVGRLSGIVYHHVPKYLLKNRLPSYKTNCIEDWNEKISHIIKETENEDLSLLSGIPPWCLDYFEKLLTSSSKDSLKELFPNLSIYVHGGVNYRPYKDRIRKLLGNNVDVVETYPASEGFFAYQDIITQDNLLLNINAGIFYEFIPYPSYTMNQEKRLFIGEVVVGTTYILVISSNAGLWAYNTGDLVRFTSLNPYKIKVVGRAKHFISAFGEHVIAEEVDIVMQELIKTKQVLIKEFTVAPMVSSSGNSHYDWYIELEQKTSAKKEVLTEILDSSLQLKNGYYRDLRSSQILAKPQIHFLPPKTFENYLKSIDKYGGQNKVQHLSNDRELVDAILGFVKNS